MYKRSSILLLKVLCSTYSKQREHASSGRLKEVKNNGKLQNCQAKKWVQLLMRGGHS